MKPNLVIDHTDTEYPPIRIVLSRDVPAGERLSICTSAFRFVYGAALTDLKVVAADGTSLDASISIRLKDGKPVRDFSPKKTFAEIDVVAALPAGTAFQIQLAPTEEILQFAGDLDWDLRIAVIDDEEYASNICRFPWHDVAEPFRVHLKASAASQIQAKRRFNGDLVIRSADRCNITAPLPDVDLTVEFGEEQQSARLDESGALRLEIDTSINEPITVTAENGWTAVSNPLPRLNEMKSVFFGDIHWHSEDSTDGTRDMAKALRSCRDELGLDFAGPSEHVLDEGDYGRSTMRDQMEVCRPFDEPGRFAVIPGYEQSRRYGHCNVYTKTWDELLRIANQYEEGFWKVLKSTKDRYLVEELMEIFEAEDTLVIPHHTNMSNESGATGPDGRSIWTAFRWPRQPNAKHLRLIELNQQRGNFESEIMDPLWQPPVSEKPEGGGLGGSAQQALAQGHRIGFIGGTDNHSGWPTMHTGTQEICGITGVIAEELSAPSIHSALHARSCYATTGARIVAQATLNNSIIGTELELEPNTERRFSVSIEGTAPIERVELISFGTVTHSFEVESDSTSFTGEWVDDRPERPLDNLYYYVRARQVDGHCIWMSPWWIDQV